MTRSHSRLFIVWGSRHIPPPWHRLLRFSDQINMLKSVFDWPTVDSRNGGTTRATTEVHHFFSEVPQVGRLRPLPKTDFEEKLKLLRATGSKFQWPRYTTRIMPKMAYYLFFFRRFWVKEPRHSETVVAKKRYTSIVARVVPVPHAVASILCCTRTNTPPNVVCGIKLNMGGQLVNLLLGVKIKGYHPLTL